MQELRFVAVSEDGRYAVLAVPGRSARFTLPIDERLRAVALGQTSRLAQYEIEVESPLRPKEIQARIRAGETVEEIADAAGIAVERVRWFEGPVLAERAYMADQARAASVRRPGESTPGPRLSEISAERLTAVGADPDDAQWDARKRGDGNWQVLLTFTAGGRLHVAEWMFDPRRRHVIPVDDNAARMSLPDVELPAPPAPSHGQATVTRLEPRVRHEAQAPLHPGSAHSATTRPEPAVSRPESVPRAEPFHAEAAQPIAVPYTPAPTAQVPTAEAPTAEALTAEAPAAPAPQAPAASVAEPAAVTVAAEPAAPIAEPAVAGPAAVAAQPTAPAVQEVAEPPAAVAEPATSVAQQDGQPAAANKTPEPAARPGGRKNARGRRSSVPSWDEIMLGSSRQQD